MTPTTKRLKLWRGTMFHSRARKEQEKRPKRRLDHTPWLHSHAVLNTQTASVLPSAPCAPLDSLDTPESWETQADFWTDDVAQKSGMTKNALLLPLLLRTPSGAQNTKVLLLARWSILESHLVTFFRQIIPQRLSQLSGSTKKLSPLCRRRSANFLLFRPWAIKAQSYEHKTRPRSSKDTFTTPTFPFTCSKREQSNSFTLSNFQRKKKAKTHKITCTKKWILDPQTSKKEASSVKLITILVAAKSSKYF